MGFTFKYHLIKKYILKNDQLLISQMISFRLWLLVKKILFKKKKMGP